MDRIVTLEDLSRVAVPAQTDSYTPVRHNDFISTVVGASNDFGFALRDSSFLASNEGKVMIAKLSFIDPNDSEMDYQVGLLNSYDKTKAATIGIGSIVRICSNGMLSAEHALKRKHTSYVWADLNEMIESSIRTLSEQHQRNIQARELLKTVNLSITDYSEIVGRMFIEEDIITVTQLSIIKKERMNEQSPFRENTMWSLYNHTTQALKTAHPANYIEQHINVHEFLTGLVQ